LKDTDQGQTPQHLIYIRYKVLDVIGNAIVTAKNGQVRSRGRTKRKNKKM